MFSHGANISSLSEFCHEHGNSYELLAEMSFSHGWMADFMDQRLKQNWAKLSLKMRIRSQNEMFVKTKENHFFVFFHLSTFQVPGYLVFGTGQPTKEGFQASLIIFSGITAFFPWYVRKCHKGQLNSPFVENHMIMAFCIFLHNSIIALATSDNNNLLHL